MTKKNDKPDARDIVGRALDAMQDGEQKTVLVLHPDRMLDSIRKSIDELISKEESILAEIATAKKSADEWLAQYGSNPIHAQQEQGIRARVDALRESSVERLEHLREQRKKYEAILNRLMDATIKKLEQE